MTQRAVALRTVDTIVYISSALFYRLIAQLFVRLRLKYKNNKKYKYRNLEYKEDII